MKITWLRSAAALAVVALLAVTGCSGDDDGDDDPQAALDTAADLLDNASSVRFALTGDDLPKSGTVVVSAEGVAIPPSSFEGEIRIRAGALPATIGVVSIDGTLWAKLPLTTSFEEVDPADVGVGDPGKLIDPDEGVSQLLKSGTEVVSAGQVRVDGDVYDQIESVIPGELVDAILVLSDPSAEVKATWAIDPDNGELRQATLTGPFYDDGEQTYTVLLDEYDKPAEIDAPS